MQRFDWKRTAARPAKKSFPASKSAIGAHGLSNSRSYNCPKRPSIGDAFVQSLLCIKFGVSRGKSFVGVQQAKKCGKVIVKTTGPGVGNRGKIAWKDVSFVIPAIPPRLSKCGIIDVSYNIELLVSFAKV
jgi:hypothetical protein